jgi:hypothetical protein
MLKNILADNHELLTYIIGSSPFALINTIWAACKEGFFPNNLVFLVNKELDIHYVDTVMQWIPPLLEEY